MEVAKEATTVPTRSRRARANRIDEAGVAPGGGRVVGGTDL